MKNKRGLLILLVVVALAIAAYSLRGRIPFDWAALGRQLRSVSWAWVAGGVAIIYSCYWLRAWRWAIFVRPLRSARVIDLFPAQVIGFTGVALVGRVADLARPYLVARKLNLPVAGQVAVYSVERAFDLAAAAAVFSITLAFAPRDLPHHATYVHAGALSLVGTAVLAAFAITLRLAGGAVANVVRSLLKPLSAKFAHLAAERIVDFRDGLGTLTSAGQFAGALGVSLLMWFGIAVSYLCCARAFVAEPTLAHLSFTAIMLVFASSIGGSLLQLPILGWFTQIGINAAALHGLLGVPVEAATACAAIMLFVATLDILPAGLIAARLQGTSLSAVARAGESAAATEPV